MDDVPDPPALALSCLAQLRGVQRDAWIDADLIDRAASLDRLRAIQALAHELAQDIEGELAATMEADVLDLAGMRLVRSEGTSSSWRNEHSSQVMRDDLSLAVATNVALDVGTGEVDPIKRNIAVATMRTALEAIPSFSSLNKRGRERLGLRMGDYRTTYKVAVLTQEEPS